jgi:hypothetical protein
MNRAEAAWRRRSRAPLSGDIREAHELVVRQGEAAQVDRSGAAVLAQPAARLRLRHSVEVSTSTEFRRAMGRVRVRLRSWGMGMLVSSFAAAILLKPPRSK